MTHAVTHEQKNGAETAEKSVSTGDGILRQIRLTSLKRCGKRPYRIFTYISFVIVLFADADQHRTISLLGLLGNLIPDTASVHGCLIAIHFAMVCLELLFMGQTAIVLL